MSRHGHNGRTFFSGRNLAHTIWGTTSSPTTVNPDSFFWRGHGAGSFTGWSGEAQVFVDLGKPTVYNFAGLLDVSQVLNSARVSVDPYALVQSIPVELANVTISSGVVPAENWTAKGLTLNGLDAVTIDLQAMALDPGHYQITVHGNWKGSGNLVFKDGGTTVALKPGTSVSLTDPGGNFGLNIPAGLVGEVRKVEVFKRTNVGVTYPAFPNPHALGSLPYGQFPGDGQFDEGDLDGLTRNAVVLWPTDDEANIQESHAVLIRLTNPGGSVAQIGGVHVGRGLQLPRSVDHNFKTNGATARNGRRLSCVLSSLTNLEATGIVNLLNQAREEHQFVSVSSALGDTPTLNEYFGKASYTTGVSHGVWRINITIQEDKREA